MSYEQLVPENCDNTPQTTPNCPSPKKTPEASNEGVVAKAYNSDSDSQKKKVFIKAKTPSMKISPRENDSGSKTIDYYLTPLEKNEQTKKKDTEHKHSHRKKKHHKGKRKKKDDTKKKEKRRSKSQKKNDSKSRLTVVEKASEKEKKAEKDGSDKNG
ncbi:hypothetical protein DICVIV_13472 [Dictyocaulus viviparus]|uniref:Uncharacterized protein n=1 Tax=Dictyocaulus viviparus TaxID=29172 RepID=A0A0D8X7P0_DICVI|nr:hypothetical protein DICVIV_13472 [Dictyocaulus viviparus]